MGNQDCRYRGLGSNQDWAGNQHGLAGIDHEPGE